MANVAGRAPSEAGAAWHMSSLDHVRLGAGEALGAPPGPLWALVIEGEVTLETASASHPLRTGDAALVDARTAHRLIASRRTEKSVLVAGDLRVTVPSHRLPSPLIVHGFNARHAGVLALVDTCPLARECAPALFATSYGNLIGAAMTASWLESQEVAASPDAAVATVVAAVTARPGEPWPVERMAGLVHMSRSALGERFRRALGRGPAEVLREVRMREARGLLATPAHPVEYVASAVGYGSTAAFSRAFSSVHGASPQAWRDAQRGEGDPGGEREHRAEHVRGRHAVPVQQHAS